MASRGFRKLHNDKNDLPPPSDDSDNDYQPLYAKKTTKSTYEGLELSSGTASEPESEGEKSDKSDNKEQNKVIEKKKKRKRNRKPKKKNVAAANGVESPELDEIDKCVMEVNALLGAPSTSRASAPPPDKPPREHHVMGVQAKHLDTAYELQRVFGPEHDADDRVLRNYRRSRPTLISKKAVLLPVPDEYVSLVYRSGLSMSINRREEGLTYFTFDHNAEYQMKHRRFLGLTHYNNHETLSIDDSPTNMHVEGLLENADTMFRVEEFAGANIFVERVVAIMQSAAHPSFNMCDMRCRLEYRFLENRPFHVALLKYLHLLSNKACHRTALEVAKLMMNLDPSDPLAVILVIDMLALRAREHQWLINAVDYLNDERDVTFLFNIKYSYAMAQYYVARKNRDDYAVRRADDLLQEAILKFPAVIGCLYECLKSPSLTESARAHFSHKLFAFNTRDFVTKTLSELMYLYCKFTVAKWREPMIFAWLMKNMEHIVDMYDNDQQFRERVKRMQNESINLFQGLPEQIQRHLFVIRPMSGLLVDGLISDPSAQPLARTRSCEPIPSAPKENRYGYVLDPLPNTAYRAIYHLMTSMMPNLPPGVADDG